MCKFGLKTRRKKMYLQLICMLFIFSLTQSARIIWDNTVDFDEAIAEAELGRSDEVRLPNWFFIYPGTKWCGAGNIAEGDNDYGEFRDTDKCCRNHDLCPDSIAGNEQKYNLTNPSFYTRLPCNCDQEFHKCLKSVNSHVSTQVGHLYFTGLGTQCFREEFPIKACVTYTYFLRKKCKIYELDNTKDKIYQWFDIPNY